MNACQRKAVPVCALPKTSECPLRVLVKCMQSLKNVSAKAHSRLGGDMEEHGLDAIEQLRLAEELEAAEQRALQCHIQPAVLACIKDRCDEGVNMQS